MSVLYRLCCFFFQAEDGIRDYKVTGVQTCALPIWPREITGWALADELQDSLGVALPNTREDALGEKPGRLDVRGMIVAADEKQARRSEEHTSELQSPCNLVCRLLLEKKK